MPTAEFSQSVTTEGIPGPPDSVSVGNMWWQSERARPGSEEWGTCLLQAPGFPCSLLPPPLSWVVCELFLGVCFSAGTAVLISCHGCFCLPWDLCKRCGVECRLSHFTGHGDVYIHLCPTSRCLWGFVVDSSSKCGQTSFRPYAFPVDGHLRQLFC